MNIKNKSLYAYIKYVTIKKRYDRNKKNKEWTKKNNLIPLHKLWLDLVR